MLCFFLWISKTRQHVLCGSGTVNYLSMAGISGLLHSSHRKNWPTTSEPSVSKEKAMLTPKPRKFIVPLHKCLPCKMQCGLVDCGVWMTRAISVRYRRRAMRACSLIHVYFPMLARLAISRGPESCSCFSFIKRLMVVPTFAKIQMVVPTENDVS